MNLNAKYDVFISYSRKDYVDNGIPIEGNVISELLDFLDKNGITYWFDKEGIYSGSEFAETIRNAIIESKMMIYVSSEHSNASQWTMGEIFVASKHKKCIVPFKIDNSEYNEKCELLLLPLDYIEYFTNPGVAFESMLKAINICKDKYDKAIDEEEKRKAEEKAKQRRAKIIEEIKSGSIDFQRHASTLAQDAQRLVEKQKLVGNNEKKCPVCHTMQPIEASFCMKCGWAFNPIFDANPKGDKDHLFVMRSMWNAVCDTDAMRINIENKIQELASLYNDKDALMATVNSLQLQLKTAKSDSQQISAQFSATENSLRDKIRDISNQLTEATRKLYDREEEIVSLRQSLSETSNTLKKVQRQIQTYKDIETEEKARHEREKENHEAESKPKAKTGRNVEVQKKAGEEERQCDVIKVGNVEFNMIFVEGGTFSMGEGVAAHNVTIFDYYIGETLVTQELWEEIMDNNPSCFCNYQKPVERVSWNDSQEFIEKLNQRTGNKFRLLTEAEWEYAARGGKKTKGYKYAGSDNIDDVAWYEDNAFKKRSTSSDYGTHPVKTKKPNELGIYDMSGNVWEWCQDWFGYYDKTPQSNPMGPANGIGRVTRGGSWCNEAWDCRSVYRFNYSPDYYDQLIGFRLAISCKRAEGGVSPRNHMK